VEPTVSSLILVVLEVEPDVLYVLYVMPPIVSLVEIALEESLVQH
jgi:hypothetical protein